MRTEQKRRVLLLGNASYREFEAATHWLRERARLTIAKDVSAAIELQSSAVPAEIVVVAQTHPGEFSGGSIQRLHRAAPLARVIGLLGTWCQGELRSGKPWPGVERVYWHQWRSRLTLLFASEANTAPRTANATDRLLANYGRVHRGQGLIAIRAEQLSAYEPLVDACRLAGYSTARYDDALGCHIEGPDLLLWDAAIWDAREREHIRHAAGRFSTPMLVTLGWPRLVDVADAKLAGAAGVLSKPLLLDDLYSGLKRLAPHEAEKKVA